MILVAKCIKWIFVFASFATLFHYSFPSLYKKMAPHKLCMIPGKVSFCFLTRRIIKGKYRPHRVP